MFTGFEPISFQFERRKKIKENQNRALYFSGYVIMTWVSLSKWNGLVNGLRHFFWLCTWENGHDLGKQQQDIWIWYIFLSLWGPFVLVQISAMQRGERDWKIERKRHVERGGGEVGLEFLTSRDVQNIGDCTERSFKCFTHFEKPYLKQFLIP